MLKLYQQLLVDRNKQMCLIPLAEAQSSPTRIIQGGKVIIFINVP